MNAPVSLCRLDDFATLRFRGADAGKFLQGQLSNDLGKLQRGALLRAGLHNPQGRTLALLWLAARADDDILALLPRELADGVTTQLRRYLLRAKLTITDESAQQHVLGLWQRGAIAAAEGLWRLDAERAVSLLAGGDAVPPGVPMTREQWRALDIAAGLPQVYGATSAEFVAQMLNLDCIEAVSFSKGCYTGQEVIARAHYRGRIKRRMQRFESVGAAHLAPGDSGQLEDGRGFRVVEAVLRADGTAEFLAVAPMTAAAHQADASVATRAAMLRARALPLPYQLPE
jgi:folate-binding protein YgfZ